MDLLQIALVFLILVLTVMLSVLGMQVFFILKDLSKSLDKFEKLEVMILNSSVSKDESSEDRSVASRGLTKNNKPVKKFFRRA